MRTTPNWRRVALAMVAFPLTVALSSAVMALTNSEDLDALAAGIFLVPMAVYAAVVARVWTLAMPLAWSFVYLGVLRIVDLATGGCSVCGSDEDWGNYPGFFLFIGVIPMTFAIAVGLSIGMVFRSAGNPRS